MSNVLDLLDQTMFDVGRARGTTTLLQCIWVYDRPIDVDGLRRFHDRLQRGRLSRRVEQSPLPFARDRWVTANGSPDIEMVAATRPREEFDTWLDAQVDTPLDCEHGPGSHLAVLPFADGGTGVSLVVPHCLSDAVGLGEALADAVLGRDYPFSWPAAASRGRWRALREDARQTAHDIPATGRALIAATQFAQRRRDGAVAAAPPPPTSPTPRIGADESIRLPAVTVFVDADEWDARARSLGGTSNTLLVGLAAHLSQRSERVAADGSVIVTMPVNERTPGDSRANALSSARFTVDPAPATTDLREIRAAIKHALIRLREVPDDEHAVNMLVPLLPKRLLRSANRAARDSSPNLVGASNVGVIDPAVVRPDGTDANSFAMRLHYLGVSKVSMQRSGGLQTLLSGTTPGRVFISLISYLPGQPNSDDVLKNKLSCALNDFSLTGTYL